MRASVIVETASQERPGIGSAIIAHPPSGDQGAKAWLPRQIGAPDARGGGTTGIRDAPFADLAAQVVLAVPRLRGGLGQSQQLTVLIAERRLELRNSLFKRRGNPRCRAMR